MKRCKALSILLIFILALSLTLSGCRKGEDTSKANEETTNIDQTGDEEVSKDISGDSGKEQKESVTDGSEETPQGLEESKEEDSEGEGISSFEGESGDKEETPQKETEVEEDEKEEKTAEEGINILKMEGKVGNPLSLSLDELKAMEDLIFEGDFYSLNNFGTTQHTRFKGVNLWGLLEKAQIASDAAKVRIVATDGYEMEFTVDEVKRQDYIDETNPDVKLPMIIAWEENGQEYDIEEGPPYKLVVGQKESGDINKPQWVSNIDRIIVE